MLNIHNITYEQSFGRMSQLPPSTCPELVFAGRSNVGKSSMINKLFSRKDLARTSQVPGKTATINFFRLDDIRFVDLPGYGYAKMSKTEQARLESLVTGYLSCDDRDLRIVFLLLDMRRVPSALDASMANFLIDCEIPFVVALTKADKLSKTQRAEQMSVIAKALPCGDDITMIPFSSKTGEGVHDLYAVIEDVLQSEQNNNN